MLKGFIGFSQELFFVKAFARSNTVLALQLFQQLQPGQNAHFPDVWPTIFDLSYVCRTFQHLSTVLEEQQIPQNRLNDISSCSLTIRNDMESLLKVVATGQLDVSTADAFRGRLRGHLARLNSVLAALRFWVHQETLVLYYTGHTLVSRRQIKGDARLELCTNASLEDADSVAGSIQPYNVSVYEHIGVKSGCGKFYDPFFIARGPNAAHEFFTAGRVFIILWSTEQWPTREDAASYEEPAVTEDRMMYSAVEGSFTGPYEGPTRVRCFVVAEKGTRTTLCLPVVNFGAAGVSQQPDRQHYGVIHRADQSSELVEGEGGMVVSPLQIPETPQRQVLTSGLEQIDLPAMDLLPTGPLPATARIDYRRWCEVELNVYCRNVGLIDSDTLLANVRAVQAL